MAIEFLRNFKLDGRLRASRSHILDVETGNSATYRTRLVFLKHIFGAAALLLWQYSTKFAPYVSDLIITL